MSMTKKVTCVWARLPGLHDVELSAERDTFLQAALDAGKTDSVRPTTVKDTRNTYYRNWSNESTANEWVTFVNMLSTKYKIPVTITVENIQ
jgi:hypothetical protein